MEKRFLPTLPPTLLPPSLQSGPPHPQLQNPGLCHLALAHFVAHHPHLALQVAWRFHASVPLHMLFLLPRRHLLPVFLSNFSWALPRQR